MKRIFLCFILMSFAVFLSGCSNSNEINNTSISNNSNTEAKANRTSANINIINNTTSETNTTVQNEIRVGIHEVEPVEEELASFSTKLGGKNTPRSRNIGITCSRLNETVVNERRNFFFLWYYW